MSTPMVRTKNWFSTHLPELHDDLAPGCSEVALTELEALIGNTFPEDFKELYRCHNGQMTEYCPGIFYGMHFLSIENIRRNWLGWKEVIDAGLEDIDAYRSAKPGAVKEVYADLGWIPFAYDYGGNCLGIDVDLGPAGTRGQVINFGRDQYEKFVLAPSLNGFLEWLADQLESGNFLIRDAPTPATATRAGAILSPVTQNSRTVQPARSPSRSLGTKEPPTYSILDSIKVIFASQRRG